MGVRSVAQGDWAWTEGDTTNKHRPATADPAAALADTADQAGSVAAELTEQAKAQPPAKAPRAQGPRHQAGPGQNPAKVPAAKPPATPEPELAPGRRRPPHQGAKAGPRHRDSRRRHQGPRHRRRQGAARRHHPRADRAVDGLPAARRPVAGRFAPPATRK